MRFTEPVVRAHNPEWAWSPTSGEGARRFGGRFNRQGRAALYTALSPLTALREASPIGRPMEPLTLCQYQVDCAPILDTRDPAACKAQGVAWDDLACPEWEMQMLRGALPRSQALAERLIDSGFAGMVAPSFARGASGEFNLVLWTWGDSLPTLIRVIDSTQRLPGNRASWS